MHLTLNGEPYDYPDIAGAAPTVADLVGRLGWDLRKVAVERNRGIVPRSQHAGTRLEPGDVIELVHFIGGG